MYRLLLLIPALFTSVSSGAGETVRVDARPLAEVRTFEHGEAPATVASLNLVTPSTEINARIVEIPVLPGDQVASGDPLVRMDCDRHELNAARIEHSIEALVAQRVLAQAQLKRAEKLIKQKNASEELVDQRRADVRRLDAEISAQRTELSLRNRDVTDCTVRAPFDGIVIERLRNVGDYATVGTPLLRLLDNRNIEVSAPILPQQIALLTSANALSFVQDGLSIPVQLRVLIAAQDPLTRTREARLTFIDQRALPGSAGRLHWQTARASVPANLLVRRGDAIGVFVADANKAQFIALDGAIEGRSATVPIDMNPDALIITNGRHALAHGDTIEIGHH
ncbi:MAG: efflux RND transporter periplasmic adaptor subunit [Gammaproteobacteria bacterium]|nr:efflux RND transporter periplasmic adaptor subunit [Gammaproteobacteria bacterium]MCP5135686.1 efflux RND transporter periplasmic adaptor subunit [Gammaproteobacteria bacterium]